MAKDNNLLRTFELCRIQPAPRGQIKVTFYIDTDSILTVSAEEKSTGKLVAIYFLLTIYYHLSLSDVIILHF